MGPATIGISVLMRFAIVNGEVESGRYMTGVPLGEEDEKIPIHLIHRSRFLLPMRLHAADR